MKKYTLEQVNKKETKKDKRGKHYKPVGIKIEGVWYNNILYDKDEIESLIDGAEVVLILYEEDGTGDYAGKKFNKFRFPSKLDLLELRVAKLEELCDVDASSKSEVLPSDGEAQDNNVEVIIPEEDDLPF